MRPINIANKDNNLIIDRLFKPLVFKGPIHLLTNHKIKIELLIKK